MSYKRQLVHQAKREKEKKRGEGKVQAFAQQRERRLDWCVTRASSCRMGSKPESAHGWPWPDYRQSSLCPDSVSVTVPLWLHLKGGTLTDWPVETAVIMSTLRENIRVGTPLVWPWMRVGESRCWEEGEDFHLFSVTLGLTLLCNKVAKTPRQCALSCKDRAEF